MISFASLGIEIFKGLEQVCLRQGDPPNLLKPWDRLGCWQLKASLKLFDRFRSVYVISSRGFGIQFSTSNNTTLHLNKFNLEIVVCIPFAIDLYRSHYFLVMSLHYKLIFDKMAALFMSI